MAKTLEERRLLASLDKLEKGNAGGDPLQNASHDGGFATEGTNIQSKAKAMKKALKGMMKGGLSREEAESLIKAMGAPDDDSSSDDEPVVKGEPNDDDSMSADDDSGDAESDDGDDDAESAEPEGFGKSTKKPSKPFSKSHGASQLANASSQTRRNEGSIRKSVMDEHPGAFDAAPVLGRLADSMDRVASRASGTDKKHLGKLQKSITEMHDMQSNFNRKVASVFVALVDKLSGVEDMVKSIHDAPVPNAAKPTLRKSQLREPSFGDGGVSAIDGSAPSSPLESLQFIEVQEALVDMCMKSQATLDDITKFENSKGDFNLLPPAVIAQLEKRLCAAQ